MWMLRPRRSGPGFRFVLSWGSTFHGPRYILYTQYYTNYPPPFKFIHIQQRRFGVWTSSYPSFQYDNPSYSSPFTLSYGMSSIFVVWALGFCLSLVQFFYLYFIHFETLLMGVLVFASHSHFTFISLLFLQVLDSVRCGGVLECPTLVWRTCCSHASYLPSIVFTLRVYLTLIHYFTRV